MHNVLTLYANLLLLVRPLALFAVCLGSASSVVAERPNVLFFLVDDLGYTDIGCFGSTFYETPHIDSLAATGTRLTSAYAACPVCSPTRAALMTGKYPARMATTDWFGAAQQDEWKRNTAMLPANYVEELPLEETTLAEAFQEAGYQTFFAGKWHLGPEGHWPEDQGFAINRGGCAWGHPKGGKRYFSPYNNPRLENGPDGEYLTSRLADETCQFIEQASQKEEPFFAYLSFYTVHTPLMAPEAKVNRFKEKAKSLEAEETKWGTQLTSKVRLTQNMPVYAGMVTELDNAVGKVLDRLKSLGLSENTIVVFTSDNGGLSTAEGSPTSNYPLRAGKGWMYEGGIREPTIVRWPGVSSEGSELDLPVTSADFYPSLLEMAGLPTKPEQHLDGKSFAKNLHQVGQPNEETKLRPIYWHYPHYGNQGGRPSGAVRCGKWKLIEWYETGELELFDLNADIAEDHNLVNAKPEIMKNLHGMLKGWRKEMGARMPVKNPNYVRKQTAKAAG